MLFFVLAGTGMRLGEALALQWEVVNCSAKTIRLERAFAEDVRRAMQSLLKKAKLPLHFTPHRLRHSMPQFS